MFFVFLFLQLSQRAGEIYNSFLSSKATMPVNIDSQAQLADDVLTSPQPNMFKTQQLQVPTVPPPHLCGYRSQLILWFKHFSRVILLKIKTSFLEGTGGGIIHAAGGFALI